MIEESSSNRSTMQHNKRASDISGPSNYFYKENQQVELLLTTEEKENTNNADFETIEQQINNDQWTERSVVSFNDLT